MYKNTYLNGHVIKEPLLLFLLGIKNKIFYRICSLKKILAFNAWSIKSKYDSDEYIKVLFISQGGEIDKNYFRSLIFGENCDEEYLGNVWIWRLFFIVWRYRKNYDLIISKTNTKICDLFKSKKNFVIPDWISCEIDLCCDIKTHSISKRTLKSNIKKMKKGNFEYTISKDPNDFQFFYNQMYIPYILNRHGNLGLKVSLERMTRSFENGELLFIKDEEEIIAGVIIDYKVMNGIPRTTQLGVLRGDFDYVKKGALIAIYYYAIEYLRKRNYQKYSVGLARPFINDGMLNHKLYWGANIVCETSKAFLLCLLSNKKCIKDFLLNNPFICIDRNRLTLETFTNANSKEDKKFAKIRERIYSGYEHPHANSMS